MFHLKLVRRELTLPHLICMSVKLTCQQSISFFMHAVLDLYLSEDDYRVSEASPVIHFQVCKNHLIADGAYAEVEVSADTVENANISGLYLSDLLPPDDPYSPNRAGHISVYYDIIATNSVSILHNNRFIYTNTFYIIILTLLLQILWMFLTLMTNRFFYLRLMRVPLFCQVFAPPQLLPSLMTMSTKPLNSILLSRSHYHLNYRIKISRYLVVSALYG